MSGIRKFPFLFFFIVFVSITLSVSQTSSGAELYQKVTSDIINLHPNGKVIRAHNIYFERDSARFVLNDGLLYPLSEINGKIRSALFIGKGNFRMQPPLGVERKRLEQLYRNPVFNHDFQVLFLLFNDSTFINLSAQAQLTDQQAPKTETENIISDALGYFIHDDRIDYDILKTFLDEDTNSLFYAHFYDDDRYDPFFFIISPYSDEAVSFLRRSEQSSHLYQQWEEICRFPLSSSAIKTGPFMKVLGYDIDTRMPYHSLLSDQLDYIGSTKLTATMLRPGQRWLYFYLDEKITVDSVKNADGHNLYFVKGDKQNYLFVEADKKLSQGDTLKLNIFYHSKQFLNRTVYGWIVMGDESTWYPVYGIRIKADYHFTYTYPSKFDLVSVGELVGSKEKDDMVISEWKTPGPIANASFNIGLFKRKEIREPNLPKVVVLKTEKYGIVERRNTLEEILDDEINCLRFFDYLLGSLPINTLYISESPYGHGLAYPGLIHLSTLTYVNYTRGGSEELFRAHETAHQWWGIGVDYRTYRDKWLAEGFAQFFGLWYMQKALKNNAPYFDALREWKEALLEQENPPPVALGSRANTLVLYNKAAWILHMLRGMLIDLQTMNEDLFVSIMRDFYNRFEGKKAGTEDFKMLLERHLKQNMDWFFDQWVYGVDLPHMVYAVHPVKLDNESYRVYFGVRTKNVSDGFTMPVIIEIELSNGYKARTSRWITAPLTQFEIALPMEPDEIRFNAFESVLAEVEEMRWSSFKEEFLENPANGKTEKP